MLCALLSVWYANRDGGSTMSLTNPEGVFGLIAQEQHPDDRRAGIQGSRGPRVRAEGPPVPPGATIPAHEILGGQTIVTGLTANGIYTLPAVIGPTGLVARGGLQRGDRVEWVLQNNSVVAAGTATLAVDVLGTITLRGPLVVPAGYSLHVRFIMHTAITALCLTALVASLGALGSGPNLFTYTDIYQNVVTGSTTTLGTYNQAGGAMTLTAEELLGGYVYRSVAAGGLFFMPGAAVVAAALSAKGITAAAGLRLPPILLINGPAAAVSILPSPAGDETIYNAPPFGFFPNAVATIYYVFSGPATASVIIVIGN